MIPSVFKDIEEVYTEYNTDGQVVESKYLLSLMEPL
jgi:hypothetical protein